MVSKPNERRAVLIPRTMGTVVLLLIILTLAAGTVRQELTLTLAGSVFLVLWIYSLIMTLLLALIHSRRARHICLRVIPHETAAGEWVEVVYSGGNLVQLPGILVRCRLRLMTKDGRCITHDCNPADPSTFRFMAEKRGAYFSAYDELAVFDILGFFRFAFRLPTEDNARLMVYPRIAEEAPPLNARAGESRLKPEFSLRRTDNMIDHRPYVPGDDPRRINWKLYGHGGGLFVRDGERAPPPQSNMVILIDTEYDPLLYDMAAARQGIDVLCENALAAALSCEELGMEVFTGYSGGIIRGVNNTEPAASLALPAALPLSSGAELPAAPADCGILILALPRSSAEASALDRFLRDTKSKSQTVTLLFLCADGNTNTNTNTIARSERLAAAEVCAALYNQRPGVRAKVSAADL